MVMKITSNTRRMSMNGVTLISARGSILRRFFFKLLLRVVVVITDSKRGGFVPSGVRRTMRLSGFEHHRLGPARRFVLGFLPMRFTDSSKPGTRRLCGGECAFERGEFVGGEAGHKARFYQWLVDTTAMTL